MGHQTQNHMPLHSTKHAEQARTREPEGLALWSLVSSMSIMHHLVEDLKFATCFSTFFKYRRHEHLDICSPMI